MDANILRDSILTRIENNRFQAYVHTCAIMWKVCFQELRALTNTKQLSDDGLNVNPMELNDIYEHVWNLGVLLKTDECLAILLEEFRPWPKVCPLVPTALTATLSRPLRSTILSLRSVPPSKKPRPCRSPPRTYRLAPPAKHHSPRKALRHPH